MFVLFASSYAEILTPKMMILGGRAFGEMFSKENRALMNKIHDLIKEARELV